MDFVSWTMALRVQYDDAHHTRPSTHLMDVPDFELSVVLVIVFAFGRDDLAAVLIQTLITISMRLGLVKVKHVHRVHPPLTHTTGPFGRTCFEGSSSHRPRPDGSHAAQGQCALRTPPAAAHGQLRDKRTVRSLPATASAYAGRRSSACCNLLPALCFGSSRHAISTSSATHPTHSSGSSRSRYATARLSPLFTLGVRLLSHHGASCV